MCGGCNFICERVLLGHLQLHAQRGRLLAAQQRRVAVELALVRVGVLGLGF